MKSNGAPGVALLDYDGDGDLDLYVTNGPGKDNALYRNRLAEDGRFSLDAGPRRRRRGGHRAGLDRRLLRRHRQRRRPRPAGPRPQGGQSPLREPGRALRRDQQPGGQRHRPGRRFRPVVLRHGRPQRRRPARHLHRPHLRLDVQGGDPRRALGAQRVQPALPQPWAATASRTSAPTSGIQNFRDITWGVAMFDFDGDGDIDILTANDQGTIPVLQVRRLQPRARPALQERRQRPLHRRHRHVGPDQAPATTWGSRWPISTATARSTST